MMLSQLRLARNSIIVAPNEIWSLKRAGIGVQGADPSREAVYSRKFSTTSLCL